MSTPNIPNHADQARELRRLETMLLIRAYEDQMVVLHKKGAPGSCSSVGQEACAVGVMEALETRDRILTNHRSAAHLLARGADPARLMAEALGRVDGYCSGRSGNLHVAAKQLGVVLTSTIVGGELSMAPGVALAQKLLEGDAEHPPGGIVVVFFGDGAACEGIFHESLNLAVQWALPVLYVCENNQWQAYVHRLETMADNAIAAWARGHGLPVQSVDGNDVAGVHDAATRAVKAIRATGTPQFLELRTYRLRGHYGPDDQAYVDPDELRRWQDRDPIALLRSRLLESGLAPATLETIERRVTARIEAAVTAAEASPWPSVDELTRYAYA